MYNIINYKVNKRIKPIDVLQEFEYLMRKIMQTIQNASKN